MVGLGENEARGQLLAGIGERLKPSEAPTFPGIVHAGEPSPAFPAAENASPATVGASAPVRKTWVKVDDVIVAVDVLDDAGETITLKGSFDDDALRRLDALRRSGFTNPRVRFVSADRVAEVDLGPVRRTTSAGRTEATVELTRAQAVRGGISRAGTGGLSPDDLVEAGMHNYFLGEPLPASLGMLEHMADPRFDREALARAFALDDPAAGDVVRVLLVEALVGRGNAQAVTRVEIGPRDADARQVLIEWLEPLEYINVEPQLRRVEGMWRLP